MIPYAAKALIARFPLGIVATIAADGSPAASPKGTFLVLDDHRIAFADIRSPGTVTNLRADHRTEVVFVDPFARTGARLSGSARVVGGDEPEFGELLPLWRTVWPPLADRIAALVVIEVCTVKPLTTPPYDDGVTQEEMIALYKAKYVEIYP